MTENPAAPQGPRLTMAEWAVGVIRSLSLQNILTLALLVVIAVPSWFAWRFMQDTAFRHEFMSSSRIVDYGVPCLVAISNNLGGADRVTIAVAFDLRDRMEHLVAIRSPGSLSDGEVKTYCEEVVGLAKVFRSVVQERDPDNRQPAPEAKP